MSEVNWDASEDIEAPVDDAVEQRQPLPGEDEEPADPEDFEVPSEVNEADAAEQHREVGEDEGDSYR
jgi:hypothetical protein